MSPRKLLPLLVAAPVINLANAVSAQAPLATTSDSASDPNVSTNQSITTTAAVRLPEEITITKIQISMTKFDLPTPALSNWTAQPRYRGHKPVTKERK